MFCRCREFELGCQYTPSASHEPHLFTILF
jgi:hypothetical protein